MKTLNYAAAYERYLPEIRMASRDTVIARALKTLLDNVVTLKNAAAELLLVQRRVNEKIVPIQAQLNIAIDMYQQISERRQELRTGPEYFATLYELLGFDVLRDNFDIKVQEYYTDTTHVVKLFYIAQFLRSLHVQNGTIGQKMLNFSLAVLDRQQFLQAPHLVYVLRTLDATKYRLVVNQYLAQFKFEIAASSAREALWQVFEQLKTSESRLNAELGDCSELGNLFQLHLNYIQFDISRMMEEHNYGFNSAYNKVHGRYLKSGLDLAYFAVYTEGMLESISNLGQHCESGKNHELLNYEFRSMPDFIRAQLGQWFSKLTGISVVCPFKDQISPFIEYIQELLYKQFRQYLEQYQFDMLASQKLAASLLDLFHYPKYREIYMQTLRYAFPEALTSAQERYQIDYLFILHETLKMHDSFKPILGMLLYKIDEHLEGIIVGRCISCGNSVKNLAEVVEKHLDDDDAIFDEEFCSIIRKTIDNFENYMGIQVYARQKICFLLDKKRAQAAVEAQTAGRE